jgi:hypothetical protein
LTISVKKVAEKTQNEFVGGNVMGYNRFHHLQGGRRRATWIPGGEIETIEITGSVSELQRLLQP